MHACMHPSIHPSIHPKPPAAHPRARQCQWLLSFVGRRDVMDHGMTILWHMFVMTVVWISWLHSHTDGYRCVIFRAPASGRRKILFLDYTYYINRNMFQNYTINENMLNDYDLESIVLDVEEREDVVGPPAQAVGRARGALQRPLHLYPYLYRCVYIHICIHIYIYIYTFMNI